MVDRAGRPSWAASIRRPAGGPDPAAARPPVSPAWIIVPLSRRSGIIRPLFTGGLLMFKNARMYRLGAPFGHDATALEALLATRRFRPCGPVETAAMGWSAPLGEDTAALVHGVGGCLLLCARKQERLLPSAAVAEAVDERIAEIETGEARDVGRTERRALREQVVTEMLPRAFTRSRRTLLYIDTESGWLVVDAGSEKQAEEVVLHAASNPGDIAGQAPGTAAPTCGRPHGLAAGDQRPG